MKPRTHILLPPDNKPVNSLEEYRALGGLKGLTKARSMDRLAVIAEVKKSGLRGRGGAGFPTGVKWESVNADPCETKYVVCNAAEGEPGTYKDRFLLDKNPYPLLEGIMIAVYAVNAKAAYIGIKRRFERQVKRLTMALEEMTAAGVVHAGDITIVLGPDDYLFGEEKALLEVIDGHSAMPRNMPPYLLGVHVTPTSHNPTVVNNLESLSHLPGILSKGADWFRGIGSQDTPGTMIFTLSGDVKRQGVYELPLGTTVNELLHEYGGGPVGKYAFKAIFSGVANPVMTPDKFDTPMDFGSLRKAGVGLGSAGFIVYDESVSMVRAAYMLSNFLAKSSCGQCVPCNMGCRVVTEHLKKIIDGEGTEANVEKIREEFGRITNQTRCFLPVQEMRLITSLLDTFPDEFKEAIGRRLTNTRELVLPKIVDFNEATHTFSYDPYV